MAEDNNDIIEEATDESPSPEPEQRSERDNDSKDKGDSKQKPKLLGLSTSLLIKIGISLAALSLIGGLAAFFLMGSDDSAEEADPLLLEDSDTLSESDVTDPASANNEEEVALPPVDVDMESDEEESVTLPTVVKKQTDENGNVIPSDNLIDPMPDVDNSMAATNTAPESAPTVNDADASPTNSIGTNTASIDATSPDKLLKEVMALQQQLNKQQSTNHELIKQIQQLSNENKHLKNEDLTASDYVAPATPSFTDDKQAESSGDKLIQYQEYRYSQQHKLDIEPQWGEVKPDLGKN
ncbi:hypothetical protein [Methylophaga thalassica]|uniref:hypothetical protein n=1 Tax=Methylophaga aminisulfidivorans TaxID=230105 RepID=UPI003A9132D7